MTSRSTAAAMRQTILDTIAAAGPKGATVREIAEALGIHVSGTRAHCVGLTRDGALTWRMQSMPGGVPTRPAKRYWLARDFASANAFAATQTSLPPLAAEAVPPPPPRPRYVGQIVPPRRDCLEPERVEWRDIGGRLVRVTICPSYRPEAALEREAAPEFSARQYGRWRPTGTAIERAYQRPASADSGTPRPAAACAPKSAPVGAAANTAMAGDA